MLWIRCEVPFERSDQDCTTGGCYRYRGVTWRGQVTYGVPSDPDLILIRSSFRVIRTCSDLRSFRRDFGDFCRPKWTLKRSLIVDATVCAVITESCPRGNETKTWKLKYPSFRIPGTDRAPVCYKRSMICLQRDKFERERLWAKLKRSEHKEYMRRKS